MASKRRLNRSTSSVSVRRMLSSFKKHQQLPPSFSYSSVPSHIDIYEPHELKPPSYLNVKSLEGPPAHTLQEEVEESEQTKRHILLSRSQSASDISKLASVKTTTTSCSTSINSRSPVKSRIVRNRTILGSYPLFYKLSRSTSSLGPSLPIHLPIGEESEPEWGGGSRINSSTTSLSAMSHAQFRSDYKEMDKDCGMFIPNYYGNDR
nr:uncharacterized protein LOC121120113 [Lepeophtheirus salmonis]